MSTMPMSHSVSDVCDVSQGWASVKLILEIVNIVYILWHLQSKLTLIANGRYCSL